MNRFFITICIAIALASRNGARAEIIPDLEPLESITDVGGLDPVDMLTNEKRDVVPIPLASGLITGLPVGQMVNEAAPFTGPLPGYNSIPVLGGGSGSSGLGGLLKRDFAISEVKGTVAHVLPPAGGALQSVPTNSIIGEGGDSVRGIPVLGYAVPAASGFLKRDFDIPSIADNLPVDSIGQGLPLLGSTNGFLKVRRA